MPSLKLMPFFLNHEIALNLLGVSVEDNRRYLPSDGEPNMERQAKHHAVCQALAGHLDALGIDGLEIAVLRDTLRVGESVAIQQAFYFKRQPRLDGSDRVLMHAKMHTDDTVRVEASLDSARFTSDTATDFLSGRRAAYVLAVVTDIEDARITLRPFFVGTLGIGSSASELDYDVFARRRIYPSEIDQFAKADFTKRPPVEKLKTVADMAESDVKDYLAEIVGETFVPKDWGGERSDMYTTSLAVKGRHMATAFLLKGKSVKHPMRVADLGKNGDQIDRLYTEPAELFVVQSNQPITSAVVNTAQVYANDLRNPRRFMIITGAETAVILGAYGYI